MRSSLPKWSMLSWARLESSSKADSVMCRSDFHRLLLITTSLLQRRCVNCTKRPCIVLRSAENKKREKIQYTCTDIAKNCRVQLRYMNMKYRCRRPNWRMSKVVEGKVPGLINCNMELARPQFRLWTGFQITGHCCLERRRGIWDNLKCFWRSIFTEKERGH